MIIYEDDYCNACGDLLEDGVEHACRYNSGRYCSQCGKPAGHPFVCYPDARRRERVKVPPPEVNKPQQLWS